jgi:ferredoxin
MAYKITNKCASCGGCKDECPQDAITSGSPYKIDPDACIECGACESVCPTGAIIMSAN